MPGVDVITSQMSVCLEEGCQAEIRRDHMVIKPLRPRANFPLFQREQVECICPNCRRAYRFVRRWLNSSLWEIEGAIQIVTDPNQQEQIRRRIPAAA